MGIRNELAAYCLDGAVVTLGTIVENALLERVNHGSEKEPKWEARYTLAQLLKPSFKLPRPPSTRKQRSVGAELSAGLGKGVTRWREKAKVS